MVVYKRYTIEINSSNRTSGNSNNFYQQFDNNLFDKLESDTRIFVYPIRCTLPIEWKNITSSNNSLRIVDWDDDEYDISLNSGSPTTTDLAVHLENLLQNAGLTEDDGVTAEDFVVSFSSYSKSFTISWNIIGSIKEIDFSVNNSISRILGFEAVAYNVEGVNSLTSVNIPDLTPVFAVQCRSPELAKRYFKLNNNNILSSQDVFFSATVGNNVIGDNLVFNNISETIFNHEIPKSIGGVNIYFTDQNGVPLDFKGPCELILGVIVDKPEKK